MFAQTLTRPADSTAKTSTSTNWDEINAMLIARQAGYDWTTTAYNYKNK